MRRHLIKIVDRYLFTEAFSLYLIGFFAFMGFLIINQLFLEGDRLLNPNFPTGAIFKLIFLNTPYFITLSIPIAVLFATLMSMGRLAKDREIDALFTNGIHLNRLFLPFLVLSLINVVIVFYVNETLVPRANAASQRIYERYPYLREQRESEVDPVIVKLPTGAFLASTFVDKKTGAAYYAVYDTLTSQPASATDEIDDVTDRMSPSENASDNGGKSEPEPEVSSGKPGTDTEAEYTARTAVLAQNLPPAVNEDGPEEAAAALESDLSATASEASATPPATAVAPNQLFLATNGQVAREDIILTRPYLYRTGESGLVVGRETTSYFTLPLGIPLKDIQSRIRTPEELSREELQRQSEIKRQLGVNPAKDLTDFYLKFSVPFACLFLALVAMPLSLRAPRDERLLGLVLAFVLMGMYYFIYFVCKLMGYNEILPPFLAAWMQNIIYAGVAVVIFSLSRK
ncbi:MAG: hypothetical protein B1H03_01825 [Planctomycetales bacterium 4484_113]|nr:MAG: hypothetical protein B1H03_01825 [Planctomycetales bacterium 4484_113]